MSDHKHEQPDADGSEHADPIGGDDAQRARAGGEGEGFLDKVKEFFTGGPENRDSADDVDDRDSTDPDAPPAADRPVDDSAADPISSGDSGWDGSDEPPELTVPESDAVRAHTEATADDEVDEAYDSRHGSGVDDSGVLADAPLEDESDSRASTEPDEQNESESDAAATSEPDQESESDADRDRREAQEAQERTQREEEFARDHDPATHDAQAGDEFRQPGDWVAEEHDGPQVQDADGIVHDPGTPEAEAAQEAEQATDDDSSPPGESDDVSDGGHGWGSAAPVEGGATPLGHPVKAWHDTMTYVLPGEDGYEGSDPHEWFVDGEAAQRAGFRHAHGD